MDRNIESPHRADCHVCECVLEFRTKVEVANSSFILFLIEIFAKGCLKNYSVTQLRIVIQQFAMHVDNLNFLFHFSSSSPKRKQIHQK